MSDLNNVPVVASAPPPAAALDSLTQNDPNSLLGKAQAAVAPVVGAAQPHLQKAQEAASPYIASAQATIQPHVDKAKEIAAPYIAKGNEVYGQAAAAADRAISQSKAGAVDAKDRTVSATDELTTDASKTTDKAVAQGSDSLAQAQAYISGVATTVTDTITSTLHNLDVKTQTPGHPGVVSQAQTILQSATSYLPASVQSHLTAAVVEHPAAQGTAISEASANAKADEAELKDALRQLASRGDETLEEAKMGVERTIKP